MGLFGLSPYSCQESIRIQHSILYHTQMGLIDNSAESRMYTGKATTLNISSSCRIMNKCTPPNILFVSNSRIYIFELLMCQDNRRSLPTKPLVFTTSSGVLGLSHCNFILWSYCLVLGNTIDSYSY